MKKVILLATIATTLSCSQISFGADGKILPGLAPARAAHSHIINSAQDDYNVNIDNADTVPVYVTMYLDGNTPYGPAYQQLMPRTYHIGFDAPYSFINLQAACFPGGPAVVGGNYGDGSDFVIPVGICSYAKNLSKKS